LNWPDDYLIPGIEPYHVEEAGVIYCGDCRDILPYLPKVDLVLTDPPYIGLKGGTELKYSTGGVATNHIISKTMDDRWFASLEWVLMAWDKVNHGLMSFCSYHFVAELGDILKDNKLALLSWYQRNSPPPIQNVPHFQNEYIWVFKKSNKAKWRNLKTNYDIPKLTAGCVSTGERVMDSNKRALHPTQKPLSLMLQLLKVESDIILDPFLGSGTTAVAAKELGRKFIGIEISEEYCKIAVKRLRQGVLPL